MAVTWGPELPAPSASPAPSGPPNILPGVMPRPGVVPIYVREVIDAARAARLEPVRRRRPPAAGALILISVVRNEAAILGDFLAHHRRLGVDRFVMLDNASTDGTAGLLAAQPDVDLYRVRQRFLSPTKQGWIMRAIAHYGYDRWYAYADADEHLVFDGAGARSLHDLVAVAERQGLRRLRGMLVDMYAAGPLGAAERRGATLAEAFPLFDRDSYRESLCKQRISRHGGPRARKFSGRAGFAPELTKYPLFRIAAGETFDNPHHLYPYRPNFESPCLLAILHYKFTEGLAGKIRDAIDRGCYFNDSAEYRAYGAAMAEDARLTLAYPGSGTYAGPADLVACGLIAPLPGGGWQERIRRFGWRRAPPV